MTHTFSSLTVEIARQAGDGLRWNASGLYFGRAVSLQKGCQLQRAQELGCRNRVRGVLWT